MGQQEGVPLSLPELFVARGCGKRTVLNAGGAALLLQVNTRTNQEAAADALEENAKELPDRLGLGEGRIDLYRALLSVLRPESRD